MIPSLSARVRVGARDSGTFGLEPTLIPVLRTGRTRGKIKSYRVKIHHCTRTEGTGATGTVQLHSGGGQRGAGSGSGGLARA